MNNKSRIPSLANAAQQYSDNVDDNTDDCFLFASKRYWIGCALQTKKIAHSLSNITIYILRYPFPVALGVSSIPGF
jgi:hypothetical protein